ncbi:uncharacterized protein LOC115268148 [Aedes albopictus]|uniref:Uncharacterized protein n=1 Tax=Aedes albopictus TaxID=7160 RepID=A0ABM1XU03_AEDAL
MPRVSRKRKAAMLRCIRRKETTVETVPDEIRSRTSPTNAAEWEIEQPYGKIEDPYMDFNAVPGFALMDCNPGSGVPLPSAEDSIVPSELFDAHTSSVAELQIEDFNAFPLPEIPFDPMFDCWAENYGSDVQKEPATASRPFAWTAEKNPPAPAHTPSCIQPFAVADMQINQSNTLDEVGHSLSIRNTTISTEFRFESAPLSPLLADTSADLQGECSESSRTDCALGENTDDGPVDQCPSPEGHPVSPSAVEKFSRNYSFDDSIEIDCCHQNLDNRCEERLVEDQTYKPHHTNRTRSKVMIIDIPGRPSGAHGYQQLDCYCDACIKCAEFEKQTPATPDKKTSNPDTQDGKPTEARMREIYRKFNEIELHIGTYDHTRTFVKTTTESRRKSAATARG